MIVCVLRCLSTPAGFQLYKRQELKIIFQQTERPKRKQKMSLAGYYTKIGMP